MFSSANVLPSQSSDIDSIIRLHSKLNQKVVERINNSQELCMLSTYDQEANEYQVKKFLEERISEVESWRWVLDDLSKRLSEALSVLQHERHAVEVVIERLKEEIRMHSQNASRPGLLNPYTDAVEDAIIKEYKYLNNQKKMFTNIVNELKKQITNITRTEKKIQEDITGKVRTIAIEESCMNNIFQGEAPRRKKAYHPKDWQNRCEALKREGLIALTNAVVTREQVKLARVNLSVGAQADAARVDAGLRRRLHANEIKMQELMWQKEEAIRDMTSLADERNTSERTLLEVMSKMSVAEARLSERNHRPAGEIVRDEVYRKLKDEMVRLKRSTKEINDNINKISTLEDNLLGAITQIDGYMEDISHVINIDKSRIQSRSSLGADGAAQSGDTFTSADNSFSSTATTISEAQSSGSSNKRLTVILEEHEDNDDDYPFDF